MRIRKIGGVNLVFASTVLVLNGCGGGGGSNAGGVTAAPPPTLQQRSDAAVATATGNAACSAITPFYWEIGDENGVLASGVGGDNSGTAPNSATQMQIASASKWIFGAYALQRTPHAQIQSNGDIGKLNFTSGYDNMSTSTCDLANTVAGCFNAISLNGGHNSDQHAGDVGKFYYNGAHLQAYAVNVSGLGADYDSNTANTPQLAAAIQTQIGQDIALQYSNPGLAGGVVTTADNYARFLRKILNGTLQIANYLDADKICAWTNQNDCNALYSPVNETAAGSTNDINNEKWHYSLAHWVEDDPLVGDGAFSSPGAFGFYPWIDKSKTYYGILARQDMSTPATPQQAAYITSVYCGRLIRKAWLDAKSP